MTEHDQKSPMILLMPEQRQIFPLAPIALTQAQGDRRKVEKEYVGALVLDEQHGVRRIEAVEIRGPFGSGRWRRFLSRMTDAWHISVRLSEPVHLPLDNVRSLFLESVRHMGEQETGFVIDERRLEAATSISDMFAALTLPPLDDCLDVL